MNVNRTSQSVRNYPPYYFAGRLSTCKLPQSFVSVKSNNNINDNPLPRTSAFILHGSISFDVQQWQSPATPIVSQAVTKYIDLFQSCPSLPPRPNLPAAKIPACDSQSNSSPSSSWPYWPLRQWHGSLSAKATPKPAGKRIPTPRRPSPHSASDSRW